MVLRMLLAMTVIAGSTPVTAADEAPRYIVRDLWTGSRPLPFSEAVLIGDTLYVAGHVGIDPKTEQAAQKPELEAKLVMDAVKLTVESAGLSMDNLVSVTVYCTDLDLYDTFNAVYKTYFHGKYPARAFIGASRLLRGAHFEVQGIAVRSRHEH